ncbi:MAG: reductase [Firmicutes bacterium]|nr:reductase [Bacillota bacterium]
MNRRVFIQGAGLITFLLSGCGLALQSSDAQTADQTSKGGDKMKITIITGSPHKNGTSALLADKFIEGSQKAGHEVFRFNAAFEDIHPCLGCDRCGMNGPCVHQDAIAKKLQPELIAADLVVFVTPLYYFGMSAQLKTVIDRFYASNVKLSGSGKKAILMATAYDDKDWTMSVLTQHYQTVVKYLGWEDIGTVLAVGCGSRPLIERSEFPEQAYQMGLKI